jgi:hypothetical protein
MITLIKGVFDLQFDKRFMFMVFNASFNIISVAISFIGGGNRRKPQTCRKSLTKLLHNVALSTARNERDWNSQL